VYLILVQLEITSLELRQALIMILFIICKCLKLRSTSFHNPRIRSVLKIMYRYGLLQDSATNMLMHCSNSVSAIIFSDTLQPLLLVTPKFRHQLYQILTFGKGLVVTQWLQTCCSLLSTINRSIFIAVSIFSISLISFLEDRPGAVVKSSHWCLRGPVFQCPLQLLQG
jgi:hypothetical protein